MRTVNTRSTPTCYCQECGRTVDMKEKFCSGCGSLLGNIQCPKCWKVGKPSDFVSGCPKCLYLNPRGNRKSGILRLETLKEICPSSQIKKKIDDNNFFQNYKTQPKRLIASSGFSFFTNIFIHIFLSFGLIGGFLWLNQ